MNPTCLHGDVPQDSGRALLLMYLKQEGMYEMCQNFMSSKGIPVLETSVSLDADATYDYTEKLF